MNLPLQASHSPVWDTERLLENKKMKNTKIIYKAQHLLNLTSSVHKILSLTGPEPSSTQILKEETRCQWCAFKSCLSRDTEMSLYAARRPHVPSSLLDRDEQALSAGHLLCPSALLSTALPITRPDLQMVLRAQSAWHFKKVTATHNVLNSPHSFYFCYT